jgi:hypothetical protein
MRRDQPTACEDSTPLLQIVPCSPSSRKLPFGIRQTEAYRNNRTAGNWQSLQAFHRQLLAGTLRARERHVTRGGSLIGGGVGARPCAAAHLERLALLSPLPGAPPPWGVRHSLPAHGRNRTRKASFGRLY